MRRLHLPSWTRHWAADTGYLLVSQALTVVATSALAIVVARHLEPSDWGVFSAFLGVSLGLSIVVDFGLGTWLLRELSRLAAETGAERSSAEARLVTSGLVVNASLGLTLAFGALVVMLLRDSEAALTLALTALVVYGVFGAAAGAVEAALRARRRIRLVVAASLVDKVSLLVLVLVVVALDGGLLWIALSYVVAGTLRLAFSSACVLARTHLARPARADLSRVARGAFPFALGTAALNVIPRLDTAVLLAFSATSAGYFALGDRVLGPALLVPATLGSTLYPFIARDERKGRGTWRIAVLSGCLGAAICVVGILLAPTLVPLLFGDDYENAVGTVQIMLAILPFVYASSPLLAHMYSLGRERAILALSVTVSLLGTAAIAGGRAVGGTELAAGGYVLRQVLFLATLLGVGFALSGRTLPLGRRAPVPAHEPLQERP